MSRDSRCPTCKSDDQDERFVVYYSGIHFSDGLAPCKDEWHDREDHPFNCICPDHSDEPYNEP